MSSRVKVASRAVKRGRRLATRTNEPELRPSAVGFMASAPPGVSAVSRGDELDDWEDGERAPVTPPAGSLASSALLRVPSAFSLADEELGDDDDVPPGPVTALDWDDAYTDDDGPFDGFDSQRADDEDRDSGAPETMRVPRFRRAGGLLDGAGEERDETQAARTEPVARGAGAALDLALDSFPPVVEELDEPGAFDDEPLMLSPAMVERRGWARAGVAAALGLALVAAVVVYGVDRDSSLEAPTAAAQESAPVAPASDEPAAAAPVAPPKAATVSDAPPADDLPDDASVLKKQVVELLVDGAFEKAEAHARKLIRLEPEEAFGYRCLGSALQDQGKQAAATEAYSQCVQNATRGDVQECGALGGRKAN